MDEGVLSQHDAIYDGILGFLMLSTNLTIFVFIQIHRTLRKEKVRLCPSLKSSLSHIDFVVQAIDTRIVFLCVFYTCRSWKN